MKIFAQNIIFLVNIAFEISKENFLKTIFKKIVWILKKNVKIVLNYSKDKINKIMIAKNLFRA
jgi:hypothetical protein